ncbi:MAG: hypothetical protein GY703_11555 [Gammaproteobacteria bacterium]|nr:hypothetical protein [Gammaproteobacteria bacterium]
MSIQQSFKSSTKQSSWLSFRHNSLKLLGMITVVVAGSIGSSAHALVSDLVITDVTTRAFSVVWVSNEAVTDATVSVYDESLTDITDSLDLYMDSDAETLENGIVRVDVQGLQAGTSYFVTTQTESVNEETSETSIIDFPADIDNAHPVDTAQGATAANFDGTPIVNDLLIHDVYKPDQTPSSRTLVMMSVPELSDYPLTAFVGKGIDTPDAIVDLSNLVGLVMDDTSGEEKLTNIQVNGGEAIEISEYRGRLCKSQIEDQRLVRYRRAPWHEEQPAITEAEQLAACFSPADFNCDGVVDPIDFNEFLIRFGSSVPSCSFSADYDLAEDGVVDPIDFNEFLIVFGEFEE